MNFYKVESTPRTLKNAQDFIREQIDHPIVGVGSMRDYANNYIKTHETEFINISIPPCIHKHQL